MSLFNVTVLHLKLFKIRSLPQKNDGKFKLKTKQKTWKNPKNYLVNKKNALVMKMEFFLNFLLTSKLIIQPNEMCLLFFVWIIDLTVHIWMVNRNSSTINRFKTLFKIIRNMFPTNDTWMASKTWKYEHKRHFFFLLKMFYWHPMADMRYTI